MALEGPPGGARSSSSDPATALSSQAHQGVLSLSLSLESLAPPRKLCSQSSRDGGRTPIISLVKPKSQGRPKASFHLLVGAPGLELALDLQSSFPHERLEQEAEAPGGHCLCFVPPSHLAPHMGLGTESSRAPREEGNGQVFAPVLALRLFGLAQSGQLPRFPLKLECRSGRGPCGWPQALVGTHVV